MTKRRIPLFILWLHLGVFFSLDAQEEHSWILDAQAIDPSHYTGVLSGNGCLTLRSSPLPFQIESLHFLTIKNHPYPSSSSEGFNPLNLQITIDGVRLSKKNVRLISQSLDMKNATFTTKIRYGNQAEIACAYTALHHLPYVVLVRVTLHPLRPITVSVSSFLQAPRVQHFVKNNVQTLNYASSTTLLLSSVAENNYGETLCAASATFLFDEPPARQPRVSPHPQGKRAYTHFTKTLDENESYSFSVAGASLPKGAVDRPLPYAESLTLYARTEGYQALLTQHQQAWNDLWKRRIIIEGDSTAQKQVLHMLYALYSQMPSTSSPHNYSLEERMSKIYPSVLLFRPEIAKAILDDVFDHLLLPAQQTASLYGYRGAWFTSEQSSTNASGTASASLLDLRTTAYVALAVWNYFGLTQDVQWLKNKGFILLKEMADFWTSKLTRDTANHYHLRQWIQKDQTLLSIEDDAFIHAAAKASLEYAILSAQLLGIPPSAAWINAQTHISLSQTPHGFFNAYANYHGETLPYADIYLLAYPLKEFYSASDIQRHLDYYEPRTQSDTLTMSNVTRIILYTKTGNATHALHLFQKSYLQNTRPPFGVMAHPEEGMALLQSILYGWGGIEITTQGLIQKRRVLPPSWKSLTLQEIGREHLTLHTSP